MGIGTLLNVHATRLLGQRHVTSDPRSPGGVQSSAGAFTASAATTAVAPISIADIAITIAPTTAIHRVLPPAAAADVDRASRGETAAAAVAAMASASVTVITSAPVTAATSTTASASTLAPLTIHTHTDRSIVTTAMLIAESQTSPPVLTAFMALTRWPFSCIVVDSWPLLSGSLPVVHVAVGLADGVIVSEARSKYETGGGGDGMKGGPDDLWATACARTTCDTLPCIHATTATTAISPPPPAAVALPPSSAADGNASCVGEKVDDSSLLRNGDITAIVSSNLSGGRRGTSGQPRRADRIPTGSLALPTTLGRSRAASHRHRRRAAGGLAPPPAMHPRAATAALLTSSDPLQPERINVTVRAGRSRTAR